MAICLNQRYDGDRNPGDGILPNGARVPFLEIGLKSQCKLRWYGYDFIHTVTNHSGFEIYDVDWPSPSPGIVAVALAPGGVIRRTTSSLKSCVDRDKGVTNTRISPVPAPPVAYKVAPACVPGWVVLDDLKKLFSMVRDDEDTSPRNVITLAATLTFTSLQNPETTKFYEVLSQIELVSATTSTQYIYRFSVRNMTDSILEFHVDSMLSPEFPSGFKGSVNPGGMVSEEFSVDADDPINAPSELSGIASLFDGCHAHKLGVSVILPMAWVPGLVEYSREECCEEC